MQPNDITSAELGNGYKLLFQYSQKTGETGPVRAVVKDAAGNIVVRGPVVPREEAFKSRFDVISGENSSLWLKDASANEDDPDDADDPYEDEDEEDDYGNEDDD